MSGEKEDVTEDCIKAVIAHMITESKNNGGFEYSIKGAGTLTWINEELWDRLE